MKKHLLVPLFFISAFMFSQQKSFDINWLQSKTLGVVKTSIKLPAFDNNHFNYDLYNGLTFFAEWDISNIVDENSIQLSNVSYAQISKSELYDLDIRTLPREPKVSLSNTSARGNLTAYLEITPIINDNGIFKKITSFTVSYSNTSANRNSAQAADSQEIINSVLSSGNWYRFYVDKTGVFKLSKSFLNQLGVNTNGVDPRTVKIYGNGGAMLPELNSSGYPLDLTENAIRFVGESDGVFNNEDYILFYAEGPKGYNQESNTNINAYTDKSYYYVNVGGGFGKRIENFTQPEADANLVIDTFQDYQFYETDEYNIVKLGRRWFGDRFNIENERDYEFSFPNLVTTEPAEVKVVTAAISGGSTNMDVKLNGSLIHTFGFLPIDFESPTLANGQTFINDLILSSSDLTFNLKYSNNGNPESNAYLDYISVEATRMLRYEGDQIIFKNYDVADASDVVQYNIDNASSVLEVWDITNKYDVSSAINLNQENNFSFKSSAGTLKYYITVSSSDFLQPLRDNSTYVSNQNIKGTIFNNSQGQFQDIDYIIVTPANFMSQAERLAQINRDQYNLNVKVVELNKIYNEFSSGNQDVGAIRNFVKYVYDRASTTSNRLKYLCLFGDASFDYKNRISNNTNIVPTWNSVESFSLTNSFVSDDFYGMLDSNEGNMSVTNKLDIAVGRILAETPQRAKEMVDKIELYYKEGSYGSWRNNFITISDDVDQDWEVILEQTTDEIGNEVTEEKPFINVVKIHSDAYQQQSTASGERNPNVNKAIKDAVEVGALVVNYFGHGGEDGLARERIFDKNDSQDIRNFCKFNCFVTVTCEYTKFDDPTRPTAGEYTYWNKNGGAISLITTTRQIFVSVGVNLNKRLDQYLFAYNSNEYPSAAEALRLVKIDPSFSGQIQRRLVFYIGDPAMKLAFPKPNIVLTKINDMPIGPGNDVLQALTHVKLSGEVLDTSGNLLTNYNGVLTATVFDKEIDRQTLGNNGVTSGGQLIIMDFKTLGEIIFKGQATIQNGQFEFNFVVPRDIGVPVGSGKVSFYAKSETTLEDHSGSSFDIQVGGINENAEEDNQGPIINLYMNDENFVSGGITNEAPTLLAKLQDDNGINTASGIGHDIVAIIDGDETNPFILNDYYQANVDDYQNGEVSYLFRDLDPGLHTLTLKAWDVYNNSSTSEIQFVVHDKDEKLVITNVLNYPNPFVNYTEFWFNHNSSDALDVSVQIFTVSGKLVRTINGQTNNSGCCGNGATALSKDIVWDGRDDFGDKIGKGVYIYKLKVRSNQLNSVVEKIQKLVIL